MNDMTHISVRIPTQTREALDEIARQRRKQSGEEVRLADLVRAALDDYVKRHKV